MPVLYNAARRERAAHKPAMRNVAAAGDLRQRRAEHLADRFGLAACRAAAAAAERRGLVGLSELWHRAALAAGRKAVPCG